MFRQTIILTILLPLTAHTETLNDYLNEAAKNNPQLAAAYNQWQASSEQIKQQKSLPDPTISYAYYFDKVETRVGPQEQRFGITQKFPTFGKRSLKRKAATESAAAAGERYKKVLLNLNTQVTRAYSELWFLQRSINITRKRIHLLSQLEQVARTRYKTGGSMAPVTQAQMELGKLEDRLLSLEDLRQPLNATLNALLNRPSGSPLPLPATLPFTPVPTNSETLFAELAENSPELAGLGYALKGAEHREKLARREWLPDLTLGLQYIDTGDAIMPTAESGKDPIIGTVSINLPLWFDKNSARIREAGYQKTAAILTLENRQQTLEANIKKTLFKLRDAERKIGLYKNGLIPKAEQALEVTQQGYKSGKLEFINLIDAERQLLEFELTCERARANHLQHRAELSVQSGIDFLTGGTHETN
ncbi:TolC family protein [Verrucomicrobiota bacterium]